MDLKDERGYQMSCHKLRVAMGIKPGKLPEYGLPSVRLDNIIVYLISRQAAHELFPKSIKPHRVFAICDRAGCGRSVPAGRLHQHLKGHQRRSNAQRKEHNED